MIYRCPDGCGGTLIIGKGMIPDSGFYTCPVCNHKFSPEQLKPYRTSRTRKIIDKSTQTTFTLKPVSEKGRQYFNERERQEKARGDRRRRQ